MRVRRNLKQTDFMVQGEFGPTLKVKEVVAKLGNVALVFRRILMRVRRNLKQTDFCLQTLTKELLLRS